MSYLSKNIFCEESEQQKIIIGCICDKEKMRKRFGNCITIRYNMKNYDTVFFSSFTVLESIYTHLYLRRHEVVLFRIDNWHKL